MKKQQNTTTTTFAARYELGRDERARTNERDVITRYYDMILL